MKMKMKNRDPPYKMLRAICLVNPLDAPELMVQFLLVLKTTVEHSESQKPILETSQIRRISIGSVSEGEIYIDKNNSHL